MTDAKLALYQGVIVLMTLVFLVWAVGKVDSSVHRSNKTLICVLSISPEDRTPALMESCAK